MFFISNVFCFNKRKENGNFICIETKKNCSVENCPHSAEKIIKEKTNCEEKYGDNSN